MEKKMSGYVLFPFSFSFFLLRNWICSFEFNIKGKKILQHIHTMECPFPRKAVHSSFKYKDNGDNEQYQDDKNLQFNGFLNLQEQQKRKG